MTGQPPRLLVPIAVLVGVLLVTALIARWALPGHADAEMLAAALTVDFTITAPALTYLLLVRARRWPIASVVGVFVGGCVIASLALPAAHQGLLDRVKLLLVPIEAAVLIALVVATRRAIAAQPQRRDLDYADRLRRVARRLTGSRVVAGIFTTELGVLSYLVRRADRPPAGFSVHRRCGYGVVVVAVMMAMVPEIAGLHLLLGLWSPTVAWVATGLGIYTALWVVGDYRALAARRIELTSTRLFLRYGLRWEARVALRSIESVEVVTAKPERRSGDVLVVSVWGAPNLRIRFREPAVFHGLYGIHRRPRELWLRVDEPVSLRDALLASRGQ